MSARSPIVEGTLLAALAAVAFGLTTPWVQRLGVGAGPFATASALYLGASLGALSGRAEEPGVGRAQLPRLVVVALLGAAAAPTLYAWGLQRVPATTASLLLNGEAVATVLLSAWIHREHVGRRVALAVTSMALGGAVAVRGVAGHGATRVTGALAVVGAVLAWGLDNTLSRPLSSLDAPRVVRARSLVGAAVTGSIALARAEPWPHAWRLAGLLVAGATGYGLSLRMYLLAQRRVGAARTGSVFAAAPFVGALAAVAMGDRTADLSTAVAAALFALGVALHLTESHAHPHTHAATVHEHPHRHDDGHHDHAHAPPVAGEHSHPHAHAAVTHAHDHAPDVHHDHEHAG